MRSKCLISIAIMFFIAGCGGGKSITGETCGDGVAQGAEECDDMDLGSRDCASLGLGGGILACDTNCTFDVTGCDIQPQCGNGIAEYSEDCDATDLDGTACEDLGYSGGTLGCAGDCSFDESNCEEPSECGNGIAEGNEDCDDADLDGETCGSLNLGTGDLACATDCSFDVAGCSDQAVCGDDAIQYPEVCDGTDLDNMTCADFSLPPGTLACAANCAAFDTSGCSAVCGDGEITGNETCDGTNLDNVDCTDFGFTAGHLACAADCSAFDQSRCSNVPVVLVNEILLGNPDGVELLNLSGGPVDLDGWILEWWGYDNNGQPDGDVWVLPAYSLADGDRVVMLDEFGGGGQPPDVDAVNGIIQFHDNIWWGSSPGAVALYTADASPVPTDFARWSGTDFPPPAGTGWADTPDLLPSFDSDTVTLSRFPDGTDTDTAADFCVAIESMGTVNATCLQPATPGTILITEIDVSDPPNGMDQLELYNPGANTIFIGGWYVYWTSQNDPGGGGDFLPAFALPPGGYVIVMDNAGGAPYVDGAGIHIGNISWQPGEHGSCSLLEPLNFEGVDFVRWGGNTEAPDPPDTWADTPAPLPAVTVGNTLGRETLTDNNVAGDWCLMAPSLGAVNTACN